MIRYVVAWVAAALLGYVLGVQRIQRIDRRFLDRRNRRIEARLSGKGYSPQRIREEMAQEYRLPTERALRGRLGLDQIEQFKINEITPEALEKFARDCELERRGIFRHCRTYLLSNGGETYIPLRQSLGDYYRVVYETIHDLANEVGMHPLWVYDRLREEVENAEQEHSSTSKVGRTAAQG